MIPVDEQHDVAEVTLGIDVVPIISRYAALSSSHWLLDWA